MGPSQFEGRLFELKESEKSLKEFAVPKKERQKFSQGKEKKKDGEDYFTCVISKILPNSSAVLRSPFSEKYL